MAIIIPLLLLSLLSLSSATFTTTTTPPPIPSLSSSLSSLGFHDLAAAASTTTFPQHHFPITVFVPTAASLSTCPSCSLSLLLKEHTLPGLFPLPYLLSLLPGTRIQSLSPSHCLTITHDVSHSLSPSRKVFISGVELTHPNLLSSPSLIVHVISGFLSPLSPDSCSLERMTSLSFLPLPPPRGGGTHSLSPPPVDPVMRLMLKDAVIRLKLSGYGVLAIALRMKAAQLAGTGSFTVFAIDDVAVFSAGGHAYVTDFDMHVVPDRLITGDELQRMAPGTVIGTMDRNGMQVVVTESDKVNYVRVVVPDLLFNSKIAVHGVKMPFPRVNVTAAVKAVSGRYDDVAVTGVGGDAAAAVGGSNKWTAEIEDHHGL